MRKPLAYACVLTWAAALPACFGSSSGGSPEANFDAGFGDVSIQEDSGGPDATTAGDSSTPTMDSSLPPEASHDALGPDTQDSATAPLPDATADAAPEASTPEAGPVDAAPEAMGDGNTCGTGVISGSEVCSGTNLNGATCKSVVAATTGGTLACAANCLSYDLSGCTCPSAGDTACTAPNSGCFNLQNDVNNCGACGNACGAGNACSVGHCTNVLMTGSPVQMQALGLALDASHAYFQNVFDYQLYSVPLTGGAPKALLTKVVNGNGNFQTVVGGNLYWTQYFQGVFAVPVAGGSAVTISSSEAYPNTITNDGTNVFFANTSSAFSIREVTTATDTVTTVPIVVDAGLGLTGIKPMAVDASHLYWGDTIGAGTSDVYQANKDGSNVILLASGLAGSVNGLTIDANNVYFTVAPGPNGVYQVPIGGGTLTTLASAESSPIPVVTDGTNVFWMNSGGVVRRTPVGGGPLTTLSRCADIGSVASCSGQYVSMAIDSTYVYWTDESPVLPGGNGTLFETLK
jgi:hypothetical protein